MCPRTALSWDTPGPLSKSRPPVRLAPMSSGPCAPQRAGRLPQGAAHGAEPGPGRAARRGRRRRRVKGLRREEVALLASISPDYYTRLEQGRRQASEPVLDTLARVLQLDDGERAYLFELSGRDAARPRRRTAQKVHPQLQRLLSDPATTPAVVLGRRTDILAWNPVAAALFTDFAQIPASKRNFVRLVFCEPAIRALYPDWEWVAQISLAQLRMEAARDPKDPRLAELAGELSLQDPDFRRWWGAHRVAVQGTGTKVLHHPLVGRLTLD